jgi:hypothetical protein
MIVYDLRCANGHVEEQWFDSIAEYENRAAVDEFECPRCGDRAIVRQVAAPRVNSGASAPTEFPCRQACALSGCMALD